MDISKTVRKRQAKELEALAIELASLAPAELAALPAGESIKKDIRDAQGLKGGARKRLIKYIAKALRQNDPEPLLLFLARRKGSKLQQDREFHELERLRDAIIAEAIDAHRQALAERLPFQEQAWRSDYLQEASEVWPDLDGGAIHRAATRFAVTRNPVHKREIFRQLKTAQERRKFNEKES